MNRSSLLVWIAPAMLVCGLAACARGVDDSGVTGESNLDESPPARSQDGGAVLPESSTGPVEDAAQPVDAAADAAALDAAPDAATTNQGACASGFTEVGEYATWGGKVNVHRATGGAWSVDSDCTSGADVDTVTYCQKLWSLSTVQVHLAAPEPGNKPFTSGGGAPPSCGGVATNDFPGENQFACCAP